VSRPGQAVKARARNGERGTMLLTTSAGQQVALAGLTPDAVGQLLQLALQIMVSTHCEAETRTTRGHYLVPPPVPPRRVTRDRSDSRP
jgi:hypothetical protein